MSSANAETGEEAPFVYVGRKSRRPQAGSSQRKALAQSTSSGFAYSSKANDSSRKTLLRAEANVNLFCDFLRPALLKDVDTGAAYPAKLRAALEQVWPTSSSDDEDSERPIPHSIVCLGLGSPTTSRSAQIQLALLVVLREYLSTHSRRIKPPDAAIPCAAFDPVFTSDDRALLGKFDIKCTEQDSVVAQYSSIEQPTLLYMPHCDRSLYEDVLARNAPSAIDVLASALETTTLDGAVQSSPAMPNVTLLANTLTNYLDAAPRAEHASFPTLARLAPKMRSVTLPNWNPTKSQQVGQLGQLWDTIALNEMSFQWL